MGMISALFIMQNCTHNHNITSLNGNRLAQSKPQLTKRNHMVHQTETISYICLLIYYTESFILAASFTHMHVQSLQQYYLII